MSGAAGMVERMARRLALVRLQSERRATLGVSGAPLHWEAEAEIIWPLYRGEVVVLLREMRDPTAAMIAAAHEVDENSWSLAPREGRDTDPADGEMWQAMIDAALAEVQP